MLGRVLDEADAAAAAAAAARQASQPHEEGEGSRNISGTATERQALLSSSSTTTSPVSPWNGGGSPTAAASATTAVPMNGYLHPQTSFSNASFQSRTSSSSYYGSTTHRMMEGGAVTTTTTDSQDEEDDEEDTYLDEDYETDQDEPQIRCTTCCCVGTPSPNVDDDDQAVLNGDDILPDDYQTSRRTQRFMMIMMVLATSYAGERCTFKWLVDAAGPLRLLVVVVVTATHSLVLGLGGWLVGAWHSWNQQQAARRNGWRTMTNNSTNNNLGRLRPPWTSSSSSPLEYDDDSSTNHTATQQRRPRPLGSSFGGGDWMAAPTTTSSPFGASTSPTTASSSVVDWWRRPLGIPWTEVAAMAFLDVSSLMLLFVTGRHVTPTQTVFFLQAVVPWTSLVLEQVRAGRRGCCFGWTVLCGTSENDNERVSPPSPNHVSPPHDGSKCSTTHHPHTNGGAPAASTTRFSPSRNNTCNHHKSHGLPPPTTTTTTTPSPPLHPHHHHQQQYHQPLAGWGGLTRSHVRGSLGMTLALFLALAPCLYTLFVGVDSNDDTTTTTPSMAWLVWPSVTVAWNTLAFVAATLPAAASQLYKEQVLVHYKQPVSMHKLDSLLSLFQCLFCSLLSPLVFPLQGLGQPLSSQNEAWYRLYPSSEWGTQFQTGWTCLLAMDHDEEPSNSVEQAHCGWILPLVLAHVTCLIVVSVAVDQLVILWASSSAAASDPTTTTTTMTAMSGAMAVPRSLAAGMVVATALLALYHHFRETTTTPLYEGGLLLEAWYVLCWVVLLAGWDLYHRVPLSHLTFETEYPRLDQLYDEPDDPNDAAVVEGGGP